MFLTLLFYRAVVVRSFFYNLPSFHELMKEFKFTRDHQHMVNASIVNWWKSQNGSRGWRFYFEFERIRKNKNLRPVLSLLPDPEEKEEDAGDDLTWEEACEAEANKYVSTEDIDLDLTHNEDEGKILCEVGCQSYCDVPSRVLGLKLLKANLGAGFKEQKLTLFFVPRHVHTDQCDNLQTVVINDVSTIKVFDWYHPMYSILKANNGRISKE